jgi:ParB-like nuclease domain.
MTKIQKRPSMTEGDIKEGMINNLSSNRTRLAEQDTGAIDDKVYSLTLSKEQQKFQSVEKEKGVTYVDFPGGKRVRFQSRLILASEVSSLTAVHELNPRIQELLDLESVSDIYENIQRNGISLEAYAVQKEDSIYYVIDGSRRRWVAIETGCDYPIKFTQDELTKVDIAYLAYVSNLKKGLSLYEKGHFYSTFLNSMENQSIHQLSSELGISKSLISYGLSSFKIPSDVSSIFLSKAHIGRDFVINITKILSNLSADEKVIFLDECKKIKPQKSDASAYKVIYAAYAKIKNIPVNEKNKFLYFGETKVKVNGRKISLSLQKNMDLDLFLELMKKNLETI